MVLKGEKMEEA